MGVVRSEGWHALITWPKTDAWEREPCVKQRVELKGLVIKPHSLHYPYQVENSWQELGAIFSFYFSVALQAYRHTQAQPSAEILDS